MTIEQNNTNGCDKTSQIYGEMFRMNQQRLEGEKRWQQEGSKWVYVYFSNETKANYLMQNAEALKVNIKIEAI